MEGMELIAFEIISNVGTAKSLAVEALRDAREGKYEEAEEKLAEASKYFVNGHHAHASLIQKEASEAVDEFENSIITVAIDDENVIDETQNQQIQNQQTQTPVSSNSSGTRLNNS